MFEFIGAVWEAEAEGGEERASGPVGGTGAWPWLTLQFPSLLSDSFQLVEDRLQNDLNSIFLTLLLLLWLLL